MEFQGKKRFFNEELNFISFFKISLIVVLETLDVKVQMESSISKNVIIWKEFH